MKRIASYTVAAVLAASVATLSAFSAEPASAEVSFKGKTITMIIGYAPGGGTDASGRLLGEHLAKYLPGKPEILFRNMPGGDGVTALNHFATAVKPDGMTITMGSSTQTDPVTWRGRTSKYDPTKFPMIGGVIRGATVLMINKDAVPRLTDRSAKPVVIGATAGIRSGIIMPMWGGEYLGWNIKWVVGYPGTAELMLALQRGEIDMTSTANAFHIREILKGGQHVAQAQSGTLRDGKLVPREEFPDVPIFPLQIRPKLKSDIEKRAFDYWEGTNATDKWLALPPNTPTEIVKTYDEAYKKATRDKEFLERGRKTISEDLIAISGKDQDILVQQVAGTTNEVLAFIDGIKKKQGLPVRKVGPVKMTTVQVKLDDVRKGGRQLLFKVKGKTETTRVSSSKTDVKIGGKKDKRANLKAGMDCEITYPGNAQTAKSVHCK